MSFNNQAPSIPLYKNDGRGRDTYISLFNGGFSNYPYSKSYKRDFYEINYKINHPDLFKRRPIIKYISDGSGRDFFIQQNILSEHCKLKDSIDFPHILRSDSGINEFRLTKRNTKSKFEKDLINRIFYGKCPGLNTRYMSPKVIFARKKAEIEEEERLKKEEEERLRREEEANLFQQSQIQEKKKKNPYSREPLPTENDLKESIKRIFLFNNKIIDENNKVKDKAWY